MCERQNTTIHVAKEPVASFYQCHNCGDILNEENICVEPSAPPLFTCGRSLHCRPTTPALQARCTVKGLPFEGVTVVKEFVSCEEEEKIINDIDKSAWAESQSGRRKQVRHTSLGGKPAKWVGVHLFFFSSGLWSKGELQTSKGETGQFQWAPSI